MKIAKWITSGLLVLSGIAVIWNSVLWGMAKFSTIGIIGGTDGPTVIYTATAGVSHFIIPVAAFIVFLGIRLFLNYKTRK